MAKDIIRGKITIEFTNSLVPKILFEGQVDMLAMVGLPYQLSGAYSEHLNAIGDELRRKVQAKGITPDKPVDPLKKEEPKVEESKVKETIVEATKEIKS